MYMKRTKIKIIIVVILGLAIAAVLLFGMPQPAPVEEVVEEEPIVEPVEEPEIVIDPVWATNKEINEDYVLDIRFKSGLLNLPVVQARGDITDYTFYAFNGAAPVSNYNSGCEGGPCSLNDVYLRMDWVSGRYEVGGTCFLDYRNSFDDQNLIIYGHLYPRSMDPQRQLMFSGLDKLLKEENYEENKDVYINLGTEIRHYVVAYVYLFNTTNDDYDNLQYYRTNYEFDYAGNPDPGYYQAYIDNMEAAQPYDTGVELVPGDKTLTLQTCYDGDSNHVQITVCKDVTER